MRNVTTLAVFNTI